MESNTQYQHNSDDNNLPPAQNNTSMLMPPPQHVAPPVAVPQALSLYDRHKKNRPQYISTAAAKLIFTSGGMNIAWTTLNHTTGFEQTTHILTSWFIGAIIGAVIGALLSNVLQKKLIMIFSASLVTLGGILFMSLSHDYFAVISARYIDGIASGLAFAPTLVMVGEEAVKSMRGYFSSAVEVKPFTEGIWLQLICASQYCGTTNDSSDTNRIMGVCSTLFGAVAILFCFTFIIESPIFQLVRGKEEEAINSLRRLQRPFTITQETLEQLEEHKCYIGENGELSFAQSAFEGLPSLLKLSFYRAMVALSFSAILSSATAISALSSQEGKYVVWPLATVGFCRWLGAVIGAYIVDSVGRKRPMLFGMLICGGLAIGVGVCFDFNEIYDIFNVSKMERALWLLIIYQFFAGISLASSSAYLSEGFPLAIKPYYIAAAFIVEMLVQIVICTCKIEEHSYSNYFYALAALSFVYFVFGHVSMPETKQTTLREAQMKFRKVLHMRDN